MPIPVTQEVVEVNKDLERNCPVKVAHDGTRDRSRNVGSQEHEQTDCALMYLARKAARCLVLEVDTR